MISSIESKSSKNPLFGKKEQKRGFASDIPTLMAENTDSRVSGKNPHFIFFDPSAAGFFKSSKSHARRILIDRPQTR